MEEVDIGEPHTGARPTRRRVLLHVVSADRPTVDGAVDSHDVGGVVYKRRGGRRRVRIG
jgi:hypothetical protein